MSRIDPNKALETLRRLDKMGRGPQRDAAFVDLLVDVFNAGYEVGQNHPRSPEISYWTDEWGSKRRIGPGG